MHLLTGLLLECNLPVKKNILLIEPYYGGSHRAHVDTYAMHSRHNISLLTLPAQNWKWRMRGGAVTLARMLREGNLQPDVILVSDMMDVALFRSLTHDLIAQVPLALYFHENQLTYPQNTRQKHGIQYGFINYSSALVADTIFFNSVYHQEDFLQAAWRMLRHAWDFSEEDSLAIVQEKSRVLPPIMNLRRFDAFQQHSHHDEPVILWNHRWEADKNPEDFFSALDHLQEAGVDFRVILAGENFRKNPTEFEDAQQKLGERILHYGFAESFETYAALLWQADYVVSTALHDFFGMSVVEAIYCGCVPLLANRLNYPYLITESLHSTCLFADGELPYLLQRHIVDEVKVEQSALREHLTQFDLQMLVDAYDDALEALI